MTIAAIETRYAGCRFRSRLEARWAVFFDRLGIAWEYEPEGFKTSAGWYLPDFRLRIPQVKDNNHTQWFEVKPSSSVHDPRHADLARGTGHPVIVARDMARNYMDQIVRRPAPMQAYGLHPRQEDETVAVGFHGGDHRDNHDFYCALGDNRHWCQEHFALSLDGQPHLTLACDSSARVPNTSHRVDTAYAAARSARFEHGENG